MRIELSLPSEAEADVEYDPKARRLIVTPFFNSPESVQSVGRVDVVGDGGQKREFVLSVSGRTGMVRTPQVDRDRKRVSSFDSLSAADDRTQQVDLEDED